MPHYMLDTDTSSYIMKRSHETVLKRLAKVAVSDVCISVITKSELLFGVEVSPKRRQDEAALEDFLRYVEVLDFTDEASAHCARIRAELKARGRMIGSNDLFIAAHARSLGLILITNNTREFGRVRGLGVENWTIKVWRRSVPSKTNCKGTNRGESKCGNGRLNHRINPA